MLLLTLEGTHWVSSVLTVEVCLITADYTPAELATRDAMLVLDLHLDLLLVLVLLLLDFPRDGS